MEPQLPKVDFEPFLSSLPKNLTPQHFGGEPGIHGYLIKDGDDAVGLIFSTDNINIQQLWNDGYQPVEITTNWGEWWNHMIGE